MAAFGIHLDRIGKLVGEPRLGRLDPAYASAIKVRIRVNRSDASAPTLLAIAAILATEVTLSEPGGARYGLTCRADAEVAETLASALRQADAAGVASSITVAVSDATIRYGWSGGAGYGVGFPDIGAVTPVMGYGL